MNSNAYPTIDLEFRGASCEASEFVTPQKEKRNGFIIVSNFETEDGTHYTLRQWKDRDNNTPEDFAKNYMNYCPHKKGDSVKCYIKELKQTGRSFMGKLAESINT